MKILFFGDIVGRVGRDAVMASISELRRQFAPDVCVANCENASGGFGITRDGAETLLRAGIDVFTTGNHVWSKKEIIELFDEIPIIRPYNLPAGDPGAGMVTYSTPNGQKLCVINLMGRLYMDFPTSNAFFALDEAIQKADTPHILVDFHAEATSEKKALGYYADGRVSAVLGTHTHVQTADACILEGGTAYITDVGMCGASHSVLGAAVPVAVARFTSSVRRPYEAAEGKWEVHAVFIETDENGRAVQMMRL